MKTYTEEEMSALLAEVAELKNQVAELKAAAQDSEVDARIAEARAEADAQVADLQKQLDTAVLEAQAAKDEKTAIVSYLADVKAEEEAAAATAARRDERVAAVKEAASFPDEYIEARADAWAAMDDETFTAALEDWKAIAPKVTEVAGEETPKVETALVASREGEPSKSSMWGALRARNSGIDIRSIR